MARSLNLHTVLATPDDQRDEEWERALFESLQESTVELLNEQPKPGPDGWPYLMVTSEVAEGEPFLNIVDWLSARGIGLALNAHKAAPDYVFTYGMIWNFRETGEFLTTLTHEVHGGVVRFDKGQKVLAGPPTQEYLPDYVRSILRDFLADQKISAPRILVLSKDRIQYDLCFSLESLGEPPRSEHQGIAEALSWFLPQHYSIMIASEKDLPEFHPL